MIGRSIEAQPMPLDRALPLLRRAAAAVACERVGLADAAGRVLAETILADRDSPPVDVSAMDGVAIRAADAARLAGGGFPIAGESVIGGDILRLPEGRAMWIFTGGPLPSGADAVVKREWLIESEDTVRLQASVAADDIASGAHIRRAGENARAGDRIADAGRIITPALLGAMASVGAAKPLVRRRVRIAVLVTGDELVDPASTPARTGLRDTNGPALESMLGGREWIEVVSVDRARDNAESLRGLIADAAQTADCVLTTGGVSMGDHDHVPAVVQSLGARVVFHRLAIKPGKPVFAAILPGGALVLGLPGNPVSVLVTARRIGLPALAALGGAPVASVGPEARVALETPLTRPAPLTQFPIVERTGVDRVRLVPSKGSGDLPASARSDGFVEIPPDSMGDGDVAFYSWGGR